VGQLETVDLKVTTKYQSRYMFEKQDTESSRFQSCNAEAVGAYLMELQINRTESRLIGISSERTSRITRG